MGGRGSSSGMSDKPYGTEYETLYQSGNIKFVRYKNGAATTPAETMTNGRVYVTVNARDKIKSISERGRTLCGTCIQCGCHSGT